MQSVFSHPSTPSTSGAFGYQSVSDAAQRMRSAQGAKRLQSTLWEVAKGSLACAAGAGLAMVAGVSGVPAFLFFVIELFFLLACYVFVHRAQDDAWYSNDQRRRWLNKARGMFLGLCFTMGYGLSPMLSLMNVILGPQNILLALLATFLVLAVTSMLAFLCFEKQKGQGFIRGFAPQVCWVLLALLLVGVVISFMPHVSAALMVYSALSAMVFSVVLFLDIIKHLYLEDKVHISADPLSVQAQNIRASVGIFLDVVNIFIDFLTFWAALKDKNKKMPDLSSAFRTLIGVVLPMGVIAVLIAWACSGSSASAGSQSRSNQSPSASDQQPQFASSFYANASSQSVDPSVVDATGHAYADSSQTAHGTASPVVQAIPAAPVVYPMGAPVGADPSHAAYAAAPVAQAVPVAYPMGNPVYAGQSYTAHVGDSHSDTASANQPFRRRWV